MTTMTMRDGADTARIAAIEKKLLENPEIAKLIDELGSEASDANDLVRGMLQASNTRGLNAQMDQHLGYSGDDRVGKTALNTSWGCGLLKKRAHPFGRACAPSWLTVVSKMFSSSAVMASKACPRPWKPPGLV